MNEPKYYGVSSGNGNDGVSQCFPNYIVKTDKPWLLAELAGLSEFKAGEGQEWAKENMEIDGEEEYTISVTFTESPEAQDAREQMAKESEALGEYEDDCGCDYAWLILEIFPYDVENNWKRERPVYESLEDCFGEEFVKANAPEMH